jgi:hypothetical protein
VNGSAAYAAVCARQKAAKAPAVKVTDFIKPIGFTPWLLLLFRRFFDLAATSGCACRLRVSL